MTNPLLNGRARRRLYLTSYVAALAVSIMLTVLLSVIVSRSTMSLPDRLAVVNAVFAGGSLILTLTAAGLALQSYVATTGLPSIDVQAWLSGGDVNQMIVVASRRPDGALRSLDVAGHASLHVRLRNTSAYAATNVVVLVQLEGMVFERSFNSETNEWRVVDGIEGVGATAGEWLGRSPLHARSTRRLPEFDLVRLSAREGDAAPMVTLHVAADGYNRQVPIQVYFVAVDSGVAEPMESPPPPSWL